MKTSKHFSGAELRRINIAKGPSKDLASLNLGANVEASGHNKVVAEQLPAYIDYNGQEGWFWKYGKEKLYGPVFSSEMNPKCNDLSWHQLHCFVTSFAWVDPKWRFLLDKPCWPLHINVVDLVVMLYRGRKHYEENQDKASPREILDVRELSRQLSEEAEAMLGNCRIETVKKEGMKTWRFMHHTCSDSTRKWIPLVLHRVLEFEDSPLPPSPVMMTAFGLDRFDS